MASIVYLSTANPRAIEVVAALGEINEGLSTLQKLNGLRAEAIAAGAATMETVFGAGDETQAQALSDRWAALLAAYADSGNTEFAKLRDMINAVIHS